MSKKLDEFVTYWHQCSGFNEHVEDFIEHARALEEMLRKHEFDGLDHHGDEVCIECRWTGHGNHAPDCALAKLIE